MNTDELVKELPYYPNWLHTARLAHISAKEQLLAAERQYKVVAATAYCRSAEAEKTHYRTESRVALDKAVQEARQARDAAEVAASRTWAEFERISTMFKVVMALMEIRAETCEQSPVA